MRLDKFLSESSSYSRSEVHKLIKKSLITADGKIAKTPDTKVTENSVICVNNIQIKYQKYVYLILNKPANYISATEDKHDPVVVDLIPEQYRHYQAFPVGRLDKDTEGMLLLTNDGRFDHALMSPKANINKRYFAKLDAPAELKDIETFAQGMEFKDFTAKPAILEITENPNEVFIEISEGKFHQVKRMCEKIGKNVTYLKRVAIGNLNLDESLKLGDVRELTLEEMKLLNLDYLLKS
jgi:16S rRNA pseudouridine516 synthase